MIEQLPRLNACLNAVCALLLCSGFLAIRRGRRELHIRLMKAAVAVSLAFLVSYLVYHFEHGATRYRGPGRSAYLALLVSHTLLAASLAALVPLTLLRAWKGDFERHRRIARWTLPIWLYVSVTGVVVYLVLHG